jgi:adhesin/invasin
VLEVSVLAKNGAGVTGNTDTVTTAQSGGGNNTEGGNNGSIIDEAAAPKISDLNIEGKLAVGQSLSGRYTFDALTGNPKDMSQYLWGHKGTTAEKVASGNGAPVEQSGIIPSYTLVNSDAGQVLEVTLRAQNGAKVSGNTATVTTVPGDSGNTTTGEGEGGTIVDEQAAPSIRNLTISGKLAVGERLTGSYTFDALTGNPKDTSQYLWGHKGTTAEKVASGNGASVEQSGIIPGYTLVNSDAGQVLEVTLRAQNGAKVSGNTATVSTAQQGEGNSTEGGNDNGEVINITAEPIVKDLKISGNISIGKVISATYKFDANKNIDKDRTLYLWGAEGTTASKVSSGEKIEMSGTVPGYKVTNEDLGKVLEVSIQANNTFDVKGNTLTAKLSIKEKPLPENTIIPISNFDFKVSDKFPTTGYDGANFRIKLDDANSYVWKSNANWVDVSDDGLITLNKNGDGKTVEISIIKKDGSYQMIYKFRITKWFFISSNQISKKSLDSSCRKEGMSPVPLKIATNANVGDSWGVRGVTNQLWPEWGAKFGPVAVFWLEEDFFSVYNITGSIIQGEEDESLRFICYKQL